MIKKSKIFPKNFLWGAATSSHQVEGNNVNNDWSRWEASGKVNEPSGDACAQYDLFKSDFKLAKSLGHNAHRFSLEWSRIEPQEGRFDNEAISHYRGMIKELRLLGIEPIITLNHFTVPLWFYERGGWMWKRSAEKFASFASRMAIELGKDACLWLTINEPVGNINSAYIEGSWPPGKQSLRDAACVFTRLLMAHCQSYMAIHKVYREKKWPLPKVSYAHFTASYTPCNAASGLDVLSARLRHYYINVLFFDSIIKGYCIAPGIPKTKLPAKRLIDYIGINYYARDYVHFWGLSPIKIFGRICSLEHHLNSGKRNFLKWEIYPKGLYELLMEFTKYKMPILVTENGICSSDDNDRIDFIKLHINEVERAISDGCSVFGYIYWSLIDNFEWAHGFSPRFGLVEVDYMTQKRIVRPSAHIYRDIIMSARS